MQGHLNEVYVSARDRTGEEVPLLINAVRHEASGPPVNECVLIAMRRRNQYEDEILKAKRAAEIANSEKDQVMESLQVARDALVRKHEELQVRNCQLEQMRETLEEQVLERTARLERQTKELQSFNYSIAHDFRAPLRAILSTSMLLLKGGENVLEIEQKDLIHRQVYNARRLSRLVDDLLQFSRLSLLQLRTESVDLTELASMASSAKNVTEAGQGVVFAIQPGLWAVGDPDAIRLVLQCLFENAAKFSPEGGLVSFGDMKLNGTRAFFVRDEGIGIDMRYAEKIFQPFQRLHLDQEFTGTGIGLAVVERLVSRHGGRIWLESEPGKGSTFFFTLAEGLVSGS
jgi:light-regulated signal transduction histidine kinase (bacteriophytochrome)